MKTKHVKNTGQMIRRAQIGKLPGGGQTGQTAREGKGGKKLHRGGAFPLLPHIYNPQRRHEIHTQSTNHPDINIGILVFI